MIFGHMITIWDNSVSLRRMRNTTEYKLLNSSYINRWAAIDRRVKSIVVVCEEFCVNYKSKTATDETKCFSMRKLYVYICIFFKFLIIIFIINSKFLKQNLCGLLKYVEYNSEKFQNHWEKLLKFRVLRWCLCCLFKRFFFIKLCYVYYKRKKNIQVLNEL